MNRFLRFISSSFMIGAIIGTMSFGLLLSPDQPVFANALGDPVARGGGAAAGDGLKAVESEVKAGEITVGSSSQIVVKFRNESAKDVMVGPVNLYPSSTVNAEVGLNECGGKTALASGAECAVVVLVKGLKTGNWRVEMLLRHDGRSRIVTASLTGTVEQSEDKDLLVSDVEAIPTELDFGTLESNRPLVKSVIFRNVTSVPINISKVGVEASDQSGYTLSTDCKELKVGEACIATITWAPASKGQSDGVLIVQHDGPTKVASVNLKGSYDPPDVEKAKMFPEAVPGAGLLVSSQEEMDFGDITNEASMTMSLVNVGDAPIHLKDISLASSDKGLSIAHTGCMSNTELQPIEACPLTVQWSPVRAGELIEDIRIRHDGARGVLVVPVRGNADMAVNKDTQAVMLSDLGIPEIKPLDKKQALEGFVITSHSSNKAIINGPGGSRVISNAQSVVLGGVEWMPQITDNGIEFLNGKDRVRLLFDRSLSSTSRTAMSTVSSAKSGSSSSSTGSSSSSGSATSSGNPAQ